MALYYNNANIAQSANVLINNKASNQVFFNNALVWKKQLNIYPGSGFSYQNLGSYQPYGEASNSGSQIRIYTYGGTDAGFIRGYIGPFSAVGFSTLFINMSVTPVGDVSHYLKWGVTTSLYSDASTWGAMAEYSYNVSGWSGTYSYPISSWPYNGLYFAWHQSSSANYTGHNLTTLINSIYLQ
jgi:hypothetical protein